MSQADQEQFLASYPVSRETLARLQLFEKKLIEANQSLSLIAPSTEAIIWTRHFLDSAQLLPLVGEENTPIVDMGAGAGFPGLVLAILGLRGVNLIEHNLKKVAFLRAIAAELHLDVTIHPMKAEAVRHLDARTVTARAFRPLAELIQLATRFMGEGAAAIFPKGARAEEELAVAERQWRMVVERFPSRTSPESTIFRLSQISRRGP